MISDDERDIDIESDVSRIEELRQFIHNIPKKKKK